MDAIIGFIQDNWSVIVEHATTFIIFGVIVAAITVVITKNVLGAALEGSRERLAGAQDEIVRRKGDKDIMVKKLEEYGEDITKLKEDLSNRTRIHISDAPPKDAREGDIWIDSK